VDDPKLASDFPNYLKSVDMLAMNPPSAFVIRGLQQSPVRRP
jgi:hypothetical protein